MLAYSNPVDTLLHLQRELDARQSSDWLGDMTTGMGSFPPINVFQQGHDFVVLIEMPGVAKNDLTLQAKESTIQISGKKAVAYGDKVSVHRRERVAGGFDRTLTLPVQIDPDKIRAEFHDGILALFIPRADGDKPKSIQIN